MLFQIDIKHKKSYSICTYSFESNVILDRYKTTDFEAMAHKTGLRVMLFQIDIKPKRTYNQ